MKKDTEVKLLMQERHKGTAQRLAAARAGMSERTARQYEHAGQLPSQMKQPHTWHTREEDWPWVVTQLERDPALQGSTLFALLCEQHPDRSRPTQVRTLQRHIARWKAVHGPEQEVIFTQHTPGERAQSDFTHMADLGVTLAGEPFPHMVYHFVLTYSNMEAASICFGETFEALAEGIEKALWQLGGVAQQHRTDHLSAAVKHEGKSGAHDWTERSQALMAHYGMQPTWNNTGVAHENGDVEQSHYRAHRRPLTRHCGYGQAVTRESRSAYEHFLQDLISKRNHTRAARAANAREYLRPLPATSLAPCKEVRVTVSRFSTFHLDSNVYSVPSRLIGTCVMIRVRAETLEGYVGTSCVFLLPRLVGKHQQQMEVFYNIDLAGVLHFMLLLNAAQRQMNAKIQLELMNIPLIKMLEKEGIQLVKEQEKAPDNKLAKARFKGSNLVVAMQGYLQKDQQVMTTDEREARPFKNGCSS